jgi:hypothetical protein
MRRLAEVMSERLGHEIKPGRVGSTLKRLRLSNRVERRVLAGQPPDAPWRPRAKVAPKRRRAPEVVPPEVAEPAGMPAADRSSPEKPDPERPEIDVPDSSPEAVPPPIAGEDGDAEELDRTGT